MNKSLIRLLIVILIALLAACATPQPQTEVPPAAVETKQAPASPTVAALPSTPTEIPSPQPTTAFAIKETPSTPEVSGAGCMPSMYFVTDITVPDNSVLHPGVAFRKTWRVQNDGACRWPEGSRLVFQKGHSLNAPEGIPLPSIAPGSEIDVSLEMQAPAQSGTYRGYWRLQIPEGKLVGAVLYVQIAVGEAPGAGAQHPTLTPQPPSPTPHSQEQVEVTETPNPSPTPTATVKATPTPPPTPTDTAVPSPTLSPTPEPPTATPEPDPTEVSESIKTPPTCLAPDTQFASVLEQAETLGLGLRCAVGPAVEQPGEIQVFWANIDQADPHAHNRSLIIYNADTQLIYALEGQDPLTYEAVAIIYENRWTEDQPLLPATCGALAPPTGYQMPIRAIGKTWCENGLWNQVGWPRDSQQEAVLTVQETTHGLLLKVESEPEGDAGPKAYLIAIDLETKQATTLTTR